MKQNILLFILVFSALGLKAKKLEKKIHTITECTFSPKTKSKKALLLSKNITQFNAQGIILTQYKLKFDNGLLTAFDSIINTYHPKTQQIVKKYIYSLKDGSYLKKEITFEYDSNLLTVKTIKNILDLDLSKYIIYKYDAQQNILYEYEYMMNDQLQTTNYYFYIYDELKRISLYRETKADTIFTYRGCEYIYNDGVISRMDCESHFSKKWSEFYDNHGNMIEKRYYEADPTDTLWLQQWTYHDAHTLKSNFLYNPYDGTKTLLKYNERGLIVSKNVKDFGDLMLSNYSYKYKYDKQKNWLKQIKYYHKKKTEITLREISYF